MVLLPLLIGSVASVASVAPPAAVVPRQRAAVGATALGRSSGGRHYATVSGGGGAAAIGLFVPSLTAAAPRTRRARAARCGLLATLAANSKDSEPELTEGQRVRVKVSRVLMHVPGHKGGFEAQGAEGVVQRVYQEANLSANYKVKVSFEEPKKWMGHFNAFELELADD